MYPKKKIPIEDLERELNPLEEDEILKIQNDNLSQLETSESQNTDSQNNKKSIEELAANVMQKFKGIISICFEHYMYLYVEHQHNFVQNKFNELMKAEKWAVDENSTSKILTSARGLIDVFSKVRQRISNLNQSQAFFDIYSIFKKYLCLYYEQISARIGLIDITKQTNIADEKLCCVVINTGEYCSTMALTIQNVIKNEISSKFKDQVDLEDEKNKFVQLIANSREILSHLIALALEPVFTEMNHINWEKFSSNGNVGDALPYVNLANDYFNERVPMFRKYIMPSDSFKSENFESQSSPNYFQIICDTILAYFTQRYEAALKACKRISESGAQQLLTDLTQFKKLLVALPTLEDHVEIKKDDFQNQTVPPAYVRKVKREVETIEKMLKVIWTPREMLVDTFKALLPNQNDSDFVVIMQLKGISYHEQGSLLDSFGSSKDSQARNLITRDWVGSTKTAVDSTTQSIKSALFNVFKSNSTNKE